MPGSKGAKVPGKPKIRADIESTAKKIASRKDTTSFDRWLVQRYLKKKNSRTRKFLKALESNFLTKLLEYEIIGGMTTGSFQRKVASALGERPLEYTRWSIFFGFGMSALKYLYAWLAEGRPLITYTSPPVEWWGHVLFIANCYRYAFMKIKKDPISAIYIWPLSFYYYFKDKVKGQRSKA